MDVPVADLRRTFRPVTGETGGTTNISSQDSYSVMLYLGLLLKSVSVPQPEGAAVQHTEHQSVVGDVSETKQQRPTPHRERTPRCRGAAAEATPGHGQ